MASDSYLDKLVDRIDLSDTESEDLATKIMNGSIPDVVVSAILVALRMKGESPSEIAGFVRAMRRFSNKIDAGYAIDTAGTGGDGVGTLNASTASAILTSIVHPVAKHGNRAVSSRCGSADVLEALGYNISIEPKRAYELLKRTNFVFLFAPLYHPAMRNVATIRRTLGIRTIFNIVGPLTNPGGTRRQVIGIFSRRYMPIIAEAVKGLGYEKVVLVHGEPGIDEVSTHGDTYVYEVSGSKVDSYTISPEDMGAKRVDINKLVVSGPEESAVRMLRASRGLDRDVAEFIKVNAAFALYVAGMARDPRDGYEYSSQLLPQLISRAEELVRVNGDMVRFRLIRERAGCE